MKKDSIETEVKKLAKLRPYDAERKLFNLLAQTTGALEGHRPPLKEDLDAYSLTVDLIPCLLRYGQAGDGQLLPLQTHTCLSAIEEFHEAGASFERTGCLGDRIYALRKQFIKMWFDEHDERLWNSPDEERAVGLVAFGMSFCSNLNVFQATSAVARTLFRWELRHLPPAEAAGEIVQWAEANVSLPRGRREAIENQCKAIWNDLLGLAQPTSDLVALVKKVFPIDDVHGRWSANRALKIRIGCLRLLCRALEQARSWCDERVEIPSSWFAAKQDHNDPRSILGVCLTNRHRCMLEPLDEAKVLVEISKGNKLRHNATVYRLSLDPGEDVLPLAEAEAMLAY